ncbi:hypothetical protein, partial [Nocardia wallacei]|uniref:hypothetical protein n=1 Tax=Nocardia wallacei TaxID=480035 RepID=UPI0024570701
MPENPRCWLILGPWQTRYGDHTRTGDAIDRGVHRLVDVHAVGGRATRVLRWEQLRDSRSVHHLTSGRRARRRAAPRAHTTTTPRGPGRPPRPPR